MNRMGNEKADHLSYVTIWISIAMSRFALQKFYQLKQIAIQRQKDCLVVNSAHTNINIDQKIEIVQLIAGV